MESQDCRKPLIVNVWPATCKPAYIVGFVGCIHKQAWVRAQKHLDTRSVTCSYYQPAAII